MLRALSFDAFMGGSRAPSPVKRAPNPVTQNRAPLGGNTAQKHTVLKSSSRVSSVKVFRLSGGAVATVVELKAEHAELLTIQMLAPIQRILDRMVATAKSLSRGPLTLKRLADMGHPYGKGKRRSLGRLTRAKGAISQDVVNKQSGAFAAAWRGKMEIEPVGVTLRVINDNRVAEFLAFGTSKMREHGPQRLAVTRHLAELRSAWNKIARELARLLEVSLSHAY